MAMGLSFMFGAGVGGAAITSFRQAQLVAVVITLATSPLIALLPTPAVLGSGGGDGSVGGSGDSGDSGVVDDGGSGPFATLRSLASLPVLRLGGARLLVGLRSAMALSFHLFMTIWTPSLKVSKKGASHSEHSVGGS